MQLIQENFKGSIKKFNNRIFKKKNKEVRNKKKFVEINNSRNKNNFVKDEKLSWRNFQSRIKRKIDG